MMIETKWETGTERNWNTMAPLQPYGIIDIVCHLSLFWECVLSPRSHGREWGALFILIMKKKCRKFMIPSYGAGLIPVKQVLRRLVSLNFI